MAYDEGLAEEMRARLEGHPDVTEKKMFGGLCFLLRGNMLCGVMRENLMFRVGKANQDAAQAVAGVRPLAFTGRAMGGLVEADSDILEDGARVSRVMALALDFVGPMPAK